MDYRTVFAGAAKVVERDAEVLRSCLETRGGEDESMLQAYINDLDESIRALVKARNDFIDGELDHTDLCIMKLTPTQQSVASGDGARLNSTRSTQKENRMKNIPIINLQDENAESQFAAMIKIAAINAVLDGDCDIEDVEDLDAEGLAKSLTDKLKA